MAEERWHDFAKEKPSEDMEGRNFIVSNGHYEKIATWCGYWENEPFMGDRLCDEVVRWKFYFTPEEEKANEATRTELKAETIVPQGTTITLQMYPKSEADKVIAEKDKEIAELKAKLEDAKASHYAEMVDAGMRERRLKRALYKACANWACAKMEYAQFDSSMFMCGCITDKEVSWESMMEKCLKKAEEYK